MMVDSTIPQINIIDFKPTVFFKKEKQDEALFQKYRLSLQSDYNCGTCELTVENKKFKKHFQLGDISNGSQTMDIYLPDIREEVDHTLTISIYGKILVSRKLTIKPTPHWKVFLVHGSHHDLGYTDLPSNILREQDKYLDEVINYCDKTEDWPEESKFRYVIEQSWSGLHYFSHSNPQNRAKLIHYLRQGRIELTALFGNETTELCGNEELVRLLYPSFQIHRRFGIPIVSAELNDVVGFSWGLATVLAESGIRYFAPAIPDYFSWGKTVRSLWDEAAVLGRDVCGAFWWEAPNKKRILLWYSGGVVNNVMMWTYEEAKKEINTVLSHLTQNNYPHEIVRLKTQGGGRDNSPPDIRISPIARQWNEIWEFPKLIVSTNHYFFHTFEKMAGKRLKTIRGELPNTDYTVGATSTALQTGINRITHDRLTAAEKFSSSALMVTSYEYPAKSITEAYNNTLLYDEHTWGNASPSGIAQDATSAQKSQFAYRAAALTDDILSKSTNRISDQIDLLEEGYYIVVYNPTSHTRKDIVIAPAVPQRPIGRPMFWQYPEIGIEHPARLVSVTALGRNLIDIPGDVLKQPFQLIDTTNNKAVSHQLRELNQPFHPSPWSTQRVTLARSNDSSVNALNYTAAESVDLIFTAEDVPSLGYKVYQIKPIELNGKPETTISKNHQQSATSIHASPNQLENRFYRITTHPDKGGVISVYDKELQCELFDGQSPYAFGQIITRKPDTGIIYPSTITNTQFGNNGPVQASMLLNGHSLGCPQFIQEIILYKDIKQIDINNRVLRDSTPLLEIFFAFPFKVEKPIFRFSGCNSIIKPIDDQIPGSNTDAYTFQHWIAVKNPQLCITWSSKEAPVFSLSQLWSSPVSSAHHAITPSDYGRNFLNESAELNHGHIYSYAMVNNFRTNFSPTQVSDTLFRYSLTSNPVDLPQHKQSQFGQDFCNPLYTNTIIGPQTGNLSYSESFCKLDKPNIDLLTIKVAENGEGIILRLVESEGRATKTTIELPFFNIVEAFRTNLMEEDIEKLPHGQNRILIPIDAYGITTIRCLGNRNYSENQSYDTFFT